MGSESGRNAYLAKNTAIFAIGNFSTKLIAFFLIPLYTNALTTEQYGVADLVTTVCTVLAPVIVLNVSEGVMRFALDEDADYNKIMSVGLLVFGAALLFGVVIIPSVQLFDEFSPYAAFIYWYTLTLAGSQIFLCYLRGKEKLLSYAVGNIIQAALTSVLNILFLVVFQMGLSGYFLAYIISALAVIVYAFFAGDVISVMRNLSFDATLARQMVSFSIVLIPNTFMWWIINSSDRIFITALLGSAANGIYAVACKIPQAVSVVAGVFNQAWSYSAIREEGSEDRELYANKVYKALAAASVISGIVLILVIKPLMSTFVEPSYFDAWRFTPYLIIGNVFMTTGTYLSSWYTVNKDSKGFLFSAMCGAVVNVSLNIFLLPVLGVTGAALATCLAMVAVFVYRVVDTRRYIKIEVFDRRQALGYLVLVLSAATVFIDGVLGELLLLVELLAALILLRASWVPLTEMCLKVMKGKVRRSSGDDTYLP